MVLRNWVPSEEDTVHVTQVGRKIDDIVIAVAALFVSIAQATCGDNLTCDACDERSGIDDCARHRLGVLMLCILNIVSRVNDCEDQAK